jgi:hypothetical protein
VETYGGLGKSARKLIKLIGSAAEEGLQMLRQQHLCNRQTIQVHTVANSI